MARLARLFIPGLAQHIAQHALTGEALFADAADFQFFTMLLAEQSQRRGCRIHAHALLPDRFHLVLTATAAAELSSFLQALGRCYVQYVNQRRARCGTLWQGRYHAAVLADDATVLQALQYVDTRPVAGALVAEPAHWVHSSFRHHVGLSSDPWLKEPLALWHLGNTPFERQAHYRQRCEQALTAQSVAALEAATRGGWLLGAHDPAVDAVANRRSRPLARGRPRTPVT